MNIYEQTIPYDETDKAAECIAENSECRCTVIEAIRYICAEHEYLNKVGFDIYSDIAYTTSDEFSFERMLAYISKTANLSTRKTNAIRIAENYYLRKRN